MPSQRSLPSRFSKGSLRAWPFALLTLAFGACGDYQTAANDALLADAPNDTFAEIAPDAGPDVAADVDAVDVAPPEDVVPDVPVADADALDAAADAVADAQDATAVFADTLPDDATVAADAEVEEVAVNDAATASDAAVPECVTDLNCQPKFPLPECQLAVCVAGLCELIGAPDGTKCEDADSCTVSDVCLGGQCAQGVQISCDDGNPCTADLCVAGACSHSAAGGPCDDGNICTLGDSCKGSACASGLPIDCEDGNLCTDESCNPAIGCVLLPNAGTCTLLDLCQTGAQCDGGTCHAGAPFACADGNPCTNDLCDPQTGDCQFLFTTTPCDDGNACTLTDTCDAGACQAASAKNCDDGSACTQDGCDPITGVCSHDAANGNCDDGSACTVNDGCVDGVCLPGSTTDCDDQNPCTDDSCDPLTGCVHSDNSGSCSVGDACELAQCQNGQCVTTGIKGCDDGNPCTTGTCVAPVGCVFTAKGDGAICSSATPCVGAGACFAGKCAAGIKTDCNDGNACTDDHCSPFTLAGCFWLPNANACEDGNFCTGVDFCANGKCVTGTTSGPATLCDDANTCTDDSCDPALGCVHTPNSNPCDDGNICTILEKCVSGVCQGGALGVCDDGNSCTLDVCAPASGACSWFAKVGSCDDANPCTIGEACSGALCVGVTVTCDDSNPCSADACDPTTGLCGHTAVASGTTCDDADACTTKDACTGLTCTGVASAASLCSDGNVCTQDVCNPQDGTCSWPAVTSACSDGNPCTVGDACSGGACIAGGSSLCDDGNFCTMDQCNAATGACVFSPQTDGVACDDGLACTDASACVSGFCAPTVANCTLISDSFTCGAPSTGWDLPVVTNTNVVWAIDQTPYISGSSTHGCTLNYNDGFTYCGGSSGFYCQVAPTLVATSPVIDATNLQGMPRLAFDTWYQLDGPLPGGTGFGDGKVDVPLVVLRDVTSKQILDQFLLSKSTSACNGPCQSVWRAISLDEPKVAGHAFRVEFSLASPSNWGNQGKGWFVDNMKATREFINEICGNGVDDDGNGRLDCADPVCAGKPGC
jgi:hypothetical protein